MRLASPCVLQQLAHTTTTATTTTAALGAPLAPLAPKAHSCTAGGVHSHRFCKIRYSLAVARSCQHACQHTSQLSLHVPPARGGSSCGAASKAPFISPVTAARLRVLACWPLFSNKSVLHTFLHCTAGPMPAQAAVTLLQDSRCTSSQAVQTASANTRRRGWRRQERLCWCMAGWSNDSACRLRSGLAITALHPVMQPGSSSCQAHQTTIPQSHSCIQTHTGVHSASQTR